MGTPNMAIGTATTSWIGSGGQMFIRVYSSDGYDVTERCCDDGQTWYTGQFAQPGSAMSAISWFDGSNNHVRVYCTFEDTTTEWRWDGTGWGLGSYTPS